MFDSLAFPTFINFVHLGNLVHTLLGIEFYGQLKFCIHVSSSLHLSKLGRVQSSLLFTSVCRLYSADHLSKSVRGLYQIEIRSYFRLVFVCTLVLSGTRCHANCFFLRLFFLGKCMCTLVSLGILGVDVSAQSTGVSLCIYFRYSCWVDVLIFQILREEKIRYFNFLSVHIVCSINYFSPVV